MDITGFREDTIANGRLQCIFENKVDCCFGKPVFKNELYVHERIEALVMIVELDEDVDVAVFTNLPASYRAENGKVYQLPLSELRSELTQAPEHFVGVDHTVVFYT